ncbi:MAG: T9SS type A sorting domain-containing protein [Candidatus Marinimicrobia bacterium]|nr:T9SS type A sorting domain-containing protein [Candidatus Neomarinimicrobiota bacterium]
MKKVISLTLAFVVLFAVREMKAQYRDDAFRHNKFLGSRDRHTFHQEFSFSDSSRNVTLIGRLSYGSCLAIFVKDNYAYVGNGGSMNILDVSDPDSPIKVGHIATPSVVEGIFISDHYAYVADGDDGLNILRNDLITREDMESHYLLYQSYPNPFNSVTTIRFRIPFSEYVTLKVFDMIGREVEMLFDKRYIPGEHEIEWSVSYHASGVYIYRLRAGDFVETKKLILLQ